MYRFAAASLALFVAANLAQADEPKDQPKKEAGPLTLKLVLKKDKVVFDGQGETPAEFKKMLETLQEAIKKGEFRGNPPKLTPFDVTLQIVNTSDKDQTLTVGGDANQYNFTLKGPGMVALSPPLAFTADFRLGKEITLAPGKSHDINLKQLADGFRGASRMVYWTGPGEYTLSATYQLAGPDGGKGPLLTSAPVKFKVVEK